MVCGMEKHGRGTLTENPKTNTSISRGGLLKGDQAGSCKEGPIFIEQQLLGISTKSLHFLSLDTTKTTFPPTGYSNTQI